MPIFQIATYRIKQSGISKVTRAIEEFVQYVRSSEPGTQVYQAWHQQEDPTQFAHVFIFADEQAQKRHGESEAVKHFENVYTPELDGGPVVFTDYVCIAGKR